MWIKHALCGSHHHSESQPHLRDKDGDLVQCASFQTRHLWCILAARSRDHSMYHGSSLAACLGGNRCSQAAVFIPCQKLIIGPQIAQLYYKHLYPWFSLPKHLILDQDLRFTSHFGRALAKELGITWNLSTVYHPQTDGLMEQKNQWVEQFLRLISTNQNDWSTMLPLATLIHNNAQNSTTGLAPNLLLSGLEPAVTPNQSTHSDNPTAEFRVNQLRQWRTQAITALNNAANSKSPSMNMFKHGQKV